MMKNKNMITMKKHYLNKVMDTFERTGSPEDLFHVHRLVKSVTDSIKNTKKFKNKQNKSEK